MKLTSIAVAVVRPLSRSWYTRAVARDGSARVAANVGKTRDVAGRNMNRESLKLWTHPCVLVLLCVATAMTALTGCRTRLLALEENEVTSHAIDRLEGFDPHDVRPVTLPEALPDPTTSDTAGESSSLPAPMEPPPSLESPALVVVPTREQLEEQVDKLKLVAERRVGAPERLHLMRDFLQSDYAQAQDAAHDASFRDALASSLTRVDLDGAVFARNAKIRRAHMALRDAVESIYKLGDDALLVDPLAPTVMEEDEGEVIDVATSAYQARPGALWFQEKHLARKFDQALATYASVVRTELVRAGALFSDYEYALFALRATERATKELVEATAGRDPEQEPGLADALARLVSDRKRWTLRMDSIRTDIAEAMDMPPALNLGPPRSKDHEPSAICELPSRDDLYRMAMARQPDVLRAEAHAAATDLVTSFACEGLPKQDEIPADVSDINAYRLKLSAARQVCRVARETSRSAQRRWHSVRNRTVIAISDAVHRFGDACERIEQYSLALPKAELAVADALKQYDGEHIDAPSLIAAILQRRNIEQERHAAFRDLATARVKLDGVVGRTVIPTPRRPQ